jgi:hypothetical protein
MESLKSFLLRPLIKTLTTSKIYCVQLHIHISPWQGIVPVETYLSFERGHKLKIPAKQIGIQIRNSNSKTENGK